MSGGIELPAPETRGNVSVEEALAKRRSKRKFSSKAITKKELSQLLWAAQGVTEKNGFRTAPSAGASYPITTYLVVQKAAGLSQGLYQYIPESHSLKKIKSGWFWKDIEKAAMEQSFISKASVLFVLAGEDSKLKRKYGERGRQYMHNEVGHVGENVHLICEAMNLGTVMVGAFDPHQVRGILGIKEEVLYIMPVGTIS